jgi:hypothetical protein
MFTVVLKRICPAVSPITIGMHICESIVTLIDEGMVIAQRFIEVIHFLDVLELFLID